MNTILRDSEIREQLTKAMQRLNARHERAFGLLPVERVNRPDIVWLADELTARLTGSKHGQLSPEVETDAIVVAEMILTDVIDASDLEQAAFWGTSLGRACAWWAGGHRPVMTRAAAAAALGFPASYGRQRVAQLVAAGNLLESASMPSTHVTRDSLRDEMRKRWPADGR